MGERVVLGRKGASSMIKIRWTDRIPGNINDVSDADGLYDVTIAHLPARSVFANNS